MDDKIMHQVWDVELEIMNVIHHVCIKNHLRYSMFYGTLLGAVRHGGFIPWDDDIDIVMPRKDYNKLIRIWEKEAPDGYILQTHDTDQDLTINFAKVRKNNTAFLQFEAEKTRKYHKGVFVDIFPMDRVAPGKMARNIQKAAACLNLLYSKGYSSGSKGIVGVGESILLKVPDRFYYPIFKKTERMIQRWNKKKDLSNAAFTCMKAVRSIFPKDMFEHLQLVKFEDYRFMATKDTDTVLRIIYGDYMKLPPKEQRVWFHHPIEVSFDKNYEDMV